MYNVDEIWIGGNDLATNGKWVWTSKGRRIAPFVQWKNGQPSGSGHCLAIEVASKKWISTDCEQEKEFICEMGKTLILLVKFIQGTFGTISEMLTQPFYR